MSLYRADPATGTVSIYKQETGKDWCNFLWNEGGFQCEITHTGASSSKFVSPTAEAIVLNEPKSGVVYFRDEETHAYWNAGGWPSAVPVEQFCCSHGQAFSSVCSECGGIETEVSFAVSDERPYEVRRVVLRNRGGRSRRISVFAGTVFRMDGYAMPFYYNAATTSETKYLADCSAVVCLSHNPYAKFASPHGFVMSSETADAFEGYLDNFTGVNGGLTRPITLEEGKDLSCSCATVRARCGLLQNKLTLAAGESRTLYYCIGFCEGEKALAEGRFAMLKEAPRLFAPERSERFGRLRREFGLPLRGGEMVQPWFAKKYLQEELAPLEEIKLVYSFASSVACDALVAAEYDAVEVNGQFAERAEGRWVDRCFRLYHIAVRKGKNEIVVPIRFGRTANIEAVYVLGNFGVKLPATIFPLPETLSSQRLEEQGLPFYGGAITWFTGIKEAGRVRVMVEDLRGASLHVSGGDEERLIAFQPYEAEVNVREELTLTLYLTRRNTFGPNHCIPQPLYAYGPDSWISEGENWSDSPVLVPQGFRALVEKVLEHQGTMPHLR